MIDPSAVNHPPSMADAAEMLWVVLANVSGGNWQEQSGEWQDAAARWRDHYFAAVAACPPPPETEEPRGQCDTCIADPSDYCATCGFDKPSCRCHPKHVCPTFGDCWCEHPVRAGGGMDRGRVMATGSPGHHGEGGLSPYRGPAPTWLCADCLMQWQAAQNTGVAACPPPSEPSRFQGTPADTEVAAILEAVMYASRGESVSDFMESFPIVRDVLDLRATLAEREAALQALEESTSVVMTMRLRNQFTEQVERAEKAETRLAELEATLAVGAACPPPSASTEHTLTLEFGRLLSESEWRDIVERARQLPYVQHLHARAVPASPPPSAAPGWQPIATAPKDGTRFFAWYPIAGTCFTSSGEHVDELAGPGGEPPTHWMPLPAPPGGEP